MSWARMGFAVQRAVGVMRLLGGLLAAATVGCVLTAGCASNCDMQAIGALHVTVVSAYGQPVCDARIVARSDRAFEEELRAFNSNCSYRGALEEAGTVSLEVTTASSTKLVKNIKVSEDNCHPLTREVVVTMDQ